jgi:hypothetical protein
LARLLLQASSLKLLSKCPLLQLVELHGKLVHHHVSVFRLLSSHIILSHEDV